MFLFRLPVRLEVTHHHLPGCSWVINTEGPEAKWSDLLLLPLLLLCFHDVTSCLLLSQLGEKSSQREEGTAILANSPDRQSHSISLSFHRITASSLPYLCPPQTSFLTALSRPLFSSSSPPSNLSFPHLPLSLLLHKTSAVFPRKCFI